MLWDTFLALLRESIFSLSFCSMADFLALVCNCWWLEVAPMGGLMRLRDLERSLFLSFLALLIYWA